jgi:condensin complex subunit 2
MQLIDYFHELSLMRDGDSINFQKASCTLDGCVKVYTTRVDAVASETNLLLSGLSNDARTLCFSYFSYHFIDIELI